MLRKIFKVFNRFLPASLLTRVTNSLEPHFTVTVSAVVIDEARRVLLLKHSFRKGNGWGLPGGFLSEDEQPDEGLRRELREETGLEIESLKIGLARAVTKSRQVQIVYRCSPVGEPKVRSIEIEGFDWFPLEELPKLLTATQCEIIKQVLSD